ncbi:SRPBCC family protein [Schumannella sp. 10F1B-5-1]|uniref:SRPBCC family protein n=1 Tax=Schumannella sp. 10F1B-5-1 TaxID=2590780 RepID=UPI0011314885|nr:SRPBCC family protein [Schumannella sp. 10F1B-5-1]TPW70063.1 SRPBCC family protein [Schumannella sp. 10F1B-5-1]
MAGRPAAASVDIVVAAPLAEVFATTVATDPAAFYPRFGPLPAVTSVSEQTAAFDQIGAHRRLHLSDGGSVIETVVEVDVPSRHVYELSRFAKLFGRLVSGARAEWVFTEETGGTRIHWTYAFHPLPGRGPIVHLIVRLFWAPYMRSVLPAIARQSGELVTGAAARPVD